MRSVHIEEITIDEQNRLLVRRNLCQPRTLRTFIAMPRELRGLKMVAVLPPENLRNGRTSNCSNRFSPQFGTNMGRLSCSHRKRAGTMFRQNYKTNCVHALNQ
jgi:hypothetical protein